MTLPKYIRTTQAELEALINFSETIRKPVCVTWPYGHLITAKNAPEVLRKLAEIRGMPVAVTQDRAS